MVLLLALAASLSILALIRFFVALADPTFRASPHLASKAAFGLAASLALWALPLRAFPAEPFLIPLGLFGLAGVFLGPPASRRSFVLGLVGVAAALAGAFAWPLLALPIALLAAHAPLPGRPSLRLIGTIPVGILLASLLPDPLLLTPVPLLLFALPPTRPYPVIDKETAWDHRMLYYLALLAVLLVAMMALFVGAGKALEDPDVAEAQVALGLIQAALILIVAMKIGFAWMRRRSPDGRRSEGALPRSAIEE